MGQVAESAIRMMKPVHALVGVDPSSLVFYCEEPRILDDGRVLELSYRVEGESGAVGFVEIVTLPEVPNSLPIDANFRDVAQLLALAAGLSYYKALAPHRVVLSGTWRADAAAFLSELVRGGLGEFAYRNGLPHALSPSIETDSPSIETEVTGAGPQFDSSQTEPGRALIAVGGGKDSIVTIEALRSRIAETVLFSVNEYPPIVRTAAAAGLPLITAGRKIDPELFALNAAGAHNGHVPVTAINSLIAILTALRGGFDTVVFSNEASSSYGNLTWQGVEVNHQWSKSIEFEELLRRHVSATGVQYISLLRPLTELAIMRRFASHQRFHSVFTSCNRSFHLDATRRTSWCGHCPKCLFVALTLAPFVSPGQLSEIFGRDVLADPKNLEGIRNLMALGTGHKPFECVGEPVECRAAVTLMAANPAWREHPLLGQPDILDARVSEDEVSVLFTFSSRHYLSGILEKAARAIL